MNPIQGREQPSDVCSIEQTIIQNGFWFVDIPRTGSTSLKEELCSLYGPAYGKSDAQFGSSPTIPWPDHTSAREAIQRLGREAWDSLFTFSMVRNPWDRAHSLFQYRRRYAMDIPLEMTFSVFVQQLAEQRKLPADQRTWYPGYTMSACDYLTDMDGRMAVKFVGKFEDRENALATINQHISIPLQGRLFRMAATAGAASFQSFYTQKDRDLIAEIYSDDITQFNYSFNVDAENSSTTQKAVELPHEDWLAHARQLATHNSELLQKLEDEKETNKKLFSKINQMSHQLSGLSIKVEYLSRRKTWVKHLFMPWKKL